MKLIDLYFCLFIKACIFYIFVEAGFGSGPGTDPYGFGDVGEACKPPFVPVNGGPWPSEFKTINILMMSKERLTRMTQQLYHSITVPPPIKDLTKGCFSITEEKTPDGSLLTYSGFGDKSFQNLVYPMGFSGHIRLDGTSGTNVGGVGITSLSNVLSFHVAVHCYDDGVGTWLVASPNRSFNESETYAVTQHLIALGFNTDHFVTLDFEGCPHNQTFHHKKYASHNSILHSLKHTA